MRQPGTRFYRVNHRNPKSLFLSITHKFSFWLVGLALAVGGLTLAEAGHTKATPAAKGVPDALVRVSTNAGANPKSAASTSVDVESNHSSSSDQPTDPQPQVSTHVTVNGQPVEVPQNGSVQQTVPNPSGGNSSFSVTVQSSSQGTTSNQNHSSSHINVFSHSSSSTSSEESSQ